MKKLILLSGLVAASAMSQASLVYGTGFETVEGFSVGAINSQSGWTTFSAPAVINAPVISAANPNSGSQHLRLADAAAATNGTLNGGFTPLFNTGGASVVSSSIDIFIPAADAGGADYTFAGQNTAESLLTFRVAFSFLGTIEVLDNVGGTIQFVDTLAPIVYGQYSKFEVISDFTAGTQTYKYGGSTIYVGNNTGLATSIDQVVLFSDSWQNPGVAGGDVDNLDVHSVASVPEPASFFAMGAGLVAFAVRRRRK